jgi:hypothetical protein
MKKQKRTILLVVLAITASTLTGIASADSFEPDNSYSNAASITTDGQAQSHSIDPAADEDWLIFTLETRSDVVIETNGISGDTVMWLYDGLVGELATDDDGGVGYFSRIQMTLSMGTYYVRIKEYNNKALISEYFVSVLATPRKILSVYPNSATKGDSLEVTIKGQGTTFFQGSSTITNVWLSKGSTTIDANSFIGIDATTLEASFDIPVNALAGSWNVHVSNSVDGNLSPFTDRFLIYTYPDLNGDGKVDTIDFALFAKHWLEVEVEVPNVTGMTQTEAQAAIESTELVVGTLTEVYSGTVPIGNIISQNPPADKKVRSGSAVNLVVSKDPWLEGKAMMGTIATAIRAFAAENGASATLYGADLPDAASLGFGANDLVGTYFSTANFSWTTAYPDEATGLTFTITATAPAGITTPAVVTLDQAGTWTP